MARPHQHTECIDDCNDCRDECERVLFQHCIEMGGRHVEPSHVRLMSDCIEICQTAANFMLRDSDHHALICMVCADICDDCADSCDEIGGAEMQRCAQTCRRCAESCREMIKEHGIDLSARELPGAGMSRPIY